MYGEQNYPEVPREQVPPGSPTNRTSSSYDGQERRIPDGYHAETTSCDNQTVLAEWQPILNRVVSVSTVQRRYVEMSKIAQRQNEPLHFPIVIKLLMTLSLSMMSFTTVFFCFVSGCMQVVRMAGSLNGSPWPIDGSELQDESGPLGSKTELWTVVGDTWFSPTNSV